MSNSPRYSQTDLITGIINRDPKIWSYAYKEYYPMIEAMVISKGGSKREVKDIYQESWLVVIKNLPSGKIQELNCKLQTYLYAICRNKWIDKVRKKGKLSISWIEDTDIPNFEEEDLEIPVYEQKLSEVLQSLGDLCKRILHAFYIRELNMEQLAKEFGFKDFTVAKTKKYKCLQKAKKHASGIINSQKVT